MAVLLLLGVASVGLGAAGGWLLLTRRPRSGASDGAVAVHTDAGRAKESRLATAVLSGDIPGVWYRHEMAVLAASDTSRAPGQGQERDRHHG